MEQKTESPINERIRRNIESITQLEQTFARQRTVVDRVSDVVSGFGGSIRFVLLNAAFISGWVLWNLLAPRELRFDASLGALQLVIAVQALLLSSFVLMTQNRQNRQTEHWAHVNLQISMLAEQETTKLLETMQNTCRFLGMEKTAHDQELKQMAQQVPMTNLIEEVSKARQPEETGLAEIAAVLVEENRAENRADAPPPPSEPGGRDAKAPPA